MPDNTNIDSMAKKYKEEMMRAYNKNRAASGRPAETEKSSVKSSVPAADYSRPPMPKIPQQTETAVPAADYSRPPMPKIPQQAKTAVPAADYSHPPMPKIPQQAKTAVPAADYSRPPMPKIPQQTETAVPAADYSHPPMPKIPQQTETAFPAEKNFSKRKFLTAEELIRLDGIGSSDHNQGNYDFSTLPDEEYKKEVENFEMNRGKGYLQVEVTDEKSGEPIEGAAIAVTEQLDGMDTLVVTLITGNDGESEIITLPAKRSEYMITVYKEGFYTVHELAVPIFDTIKSIQPVSLTALS